MVSNNKVAEGLLKVFEHRQSFSVIGLTGRTGSGCSTIAGILGKERFTDIKLEPIEKSHDTAQQKRKERLVRDWFENEDNWNKFRIIQVSHVLLMLAMSQPQVDLVTLLRRELEDSGSNRKISVCMQSIDNLISCYRSKCVSTCETLRKLHLVSIVKRKEIDTACTFLEEDLPAVAGKIRASLEKVNNHIYTKVFQAFGDNVRSSGNPLSQAVVAEALLSLPEMIARIIKIFRLRSGQSSAARNYFVIDASRHPFEIRFLRERIAPFYVMAVTTNDDDRKARLGTKLLPKEIEDLDKKEYPSESGQNRDTYRAFVSQDIQACLELADVYISNPGTSKPIDTRKTAQQVCRYVALMQRPGIVTPTHIERCMQAAFLAKLNSGCISRQVGASITDRHNSIKAIGWNDVAQGQVPCLLRNVSDLLKGRDEDAYSKYEKDDKFTDKIKELYPGDLSCSRIGGRNNMYCFKSVHNKITEKENQVHTRSLRAEENAFLQLAKYGSPGIEGGRLFTTASPCELCAKKAYQLGIKEIYYVDPYLGISNDHIFASGAEPPRVILFSGAVGRAYYELYEPLMPLNRLRKKGGRAQYSFIKHGQIEI